MNQSKYNAVREAIIKAVPEIMELKFGCETNEGIVFTPPRAGKVEIYEAGDGRLQEYHIDELKVLGRPIRLADVLLAFKKSPHRKEIENVPESWNGRWFEWHVYMISVSWNLRQDDLSLQSEETIEFLYKLLGAEKEEKTATEPQ